MNTSEPDELGRIAAAMLAQLQAPSAGVPSLLVPVAPPNPAPAALNVGAGGVSGAQNGPPTPGFLQQLPVASAPFPRESDLRSVPPQAAHLLGVPVVLDQPQPSSTPYFLELAGPPAGTNFVEPAPGELEVPDGLSLGLLPAQAPAAGRFFSPHTVKQDFPILRERVHGKPLVWLDNAATTQKPQAVIDRLSHFYAHENSNVHRAAHTLAARATDAYEGARDKVRRFLGAPSAQNIVFVRGTTEAINLVAQSHGRRHVRAGDEIVITHLEHHANIVPWQMLCSETGARLRVAPVDDRGQVIMEEYQKLLNSRTRIVSITQVSNALGTIVPVQEMVALAHRHNACVMVDGAQAVSHMPVDVQAIDCDLYCFSGHKVFGPTGIGALYGKTQVLEAMPPWQGGGNMISDVTFEKTSYHPPPQRFEAGTGNIADAVGLGAALDYLQGLGLDNVGRHEHELLGYATQELNRIEGLRLIGTAAEKAGVLSFILEGIPTEEMGGALDREGIAVRSGHHCAQPILRRFGVEATVRASLAPYNTQDDIDALVEALRKIKGLSGRGL